MPQSSISQNLLVTWLGALLRLLAMATPKLFIVVAWGRFENSCVTPPSFMSSSKCWMSNTFGSNWFQLQVCVQNAPIVNFTKLACDLARCPIAVAGHGHPQAFYCGGLGAVWEFMCNTAQFYEFKQMRNVEHFWSQLISITSMHSQSPNRHFHKTGLWPGIGALLRLLAMATPKLFIVVAWRRFENWFLPPPGFMIPDRRTLNTFLNHS